uniref:Uncharacterized protein n=1 Tax=Peronospora matthiolae TaxID=2874970 RepID=A0AAV1TLG9_9STRA
MVAHRLEDSDALPVPLTRGVRLQKSELVGRGIDLA